MPGQVVSEWSAGCVAGRTGAGGSRPRGGKPFNHPPRIAAARAKRINGRADEAREGGREQGGRVPPRPSLFIMMQESRSARASLHSSSHFSLKRERRGGGIRVIEARNLTTAGGRKERRRESGPIASPSSSSSFRRSLRRSKVIIEGETRHEGGLALSRARSRASEIGRRRERDGRARYLPEQKPIDRSDDRLFYLRPAAFLFSDIRITIFRVGHFPLATCSLFP